MVTDILYALQKRVLAFFDIFKPKGDGSIPVPVDNEETIVRAVKRRFHFKSNGELDKKAFLPRNNDGSFSVLRQVWGDDNCIQKAKEISGPDEYIGVAILRSSGVRGIGCEVTDSRDRFFLGHADVDLNLGKLPEKGSQGDIENPDLRKKFHDRCDKLAQIAKLIRDPNPGSATWTGPVLTV